MQNLNLVQERVDLLSVHTMQQLNRETRGSKHFEIYQSDALEINKRTEGGGGRGLFVLVFEHHISDEF